MSWYRLEAATDLETFKGSPKIKVNSHRLTFKLGRCLVLLVCTRWERSLKQGADLSEGLTHTEVWLDQNTHEKACWGFSANIKAWYYLIPRMIRPIVEPGGELHTVSITLNKSQASMSAHVMLSYVLIVIHHLPVVSSIAQAATTLKINSGHALCQSTLCAHFLQPDIVAATHGVEQKYFRVIFFCI